MKITKTKQEKGITLVALIITIVVLLILAVVAINSITNDGVISKAQDAANRYNEAVQNEADQLQNYLNYLNEHIGGSGNGEVEEDEPKTYAAYTVGQEIKLKNQTKETGTFYVLANSDTTEEKVTLITKLCINTDDSENIVQSSSPSTIQFAKENDWYPIEGVAEGDYVSLYEAGEEPSSDHYAAYAAYKYGEKVGGLGRLIYEAETSAVSWTPGYYLLGGVFNNPKGMVEPPYSLYYKECIYGNDNLDAYYYRRQCFRIGKTRS